MSAVDPRDRVAEAFDRAAALATEDPATFIALADRDAALRALAAIGPDAPLAGVTFAVKDNIDVAGLPTTAACPSYAYLPTADATAVARLLAAGASCVGKTNLDQFATGLVGTRSPYGTPRNPIDARLAPGGSSSGSAVAVARGVVDLALGTDTAGSGRVPAAQCRIVGIKPTPGRLSTRGVVPAVRSVDCISIFSRDVAAGVRARALAEGDDGDAFTRPPGVWPGRIRRLGIPTGTDLVLEGPADRDAWERTIARAASLDGIEVVEVDLGPLLATGRLLYESAWVAERYVAVGEHVAAGHADIDPVVRAIIEPAATRPATEAYRGAYRLAELRRAAASAWAGVDGLLTPTTPGVASLAEVAADPIGRNSRLGTYTNGVNLLGWCAVAVPGADRTDGWPFGVTVAGPAWADDAVAAVAARLSGGPAPVPAVPDGLDVAVVGAHLSGMPLNHQLVDRGAVRVCETATAPQYRLWAIAGGPVPKPALQHVGPAQGGAALAVEVWRLPWAAVGPFLAEIPAPLGLGTLTLVDGREVTGFIAEPRALDGATEVTAFGGWRAYVASR
ncbi:MAG: allophanate hydrolase [Acidimicrobiales bacterium]|nr:allophanate hydrolase [Acidimicrobiales bacterium]